ncbi:hypothetical protein BKA70DRAFT_1250059 [Coprinopsis sp. MPI-PUGE-AT-0042]|nr:hypothetical protein BKA70DRAFT_1250059 [Coprinopsis sp. MPI-PUGE-AT-0042]
MNRHHPYGAPSFEAGPPRRGGSPSGPGPDRSYRHHERGGFRGGGGRGGGGGGGGPGYPPYDNGNMSHGYDQGSQQPYHDYEAPPPPDPYYHQTDYGNPPPFSNGYGGYDQKYEDPSGPSYDNSDYNRHRDDKVHDSIIEERIQREDPCRTLFIRNIKANVRRLFEEHGRNKDVRELRFGFPYAQMAEAEFPSQYDLRSAERARDRLQGSEISGRPIDVHYSLPRDDRGGENQRNQQMQGTVQVTLRASPSGAPIDDNELRRRFQSFGDIKSILPVNDRIDSRHVEFYDTRAAEEAFDRLKQSPLQDGVMDMVLAWDNTENQFRDGSGPAGGGGHGRNWEDRGHRGGGRDGGGGRGRHGYGGGRSRPRYDDDYGRGGPGPRDGPPGGYNDRYDTPPGPPRGGYGGPPGPGYGPPPPGPHQLPILMECLPVPSPRTCSRPSGSGTQSSTAARSVKQPSGGGSGAATPPIPPPAQGGAPPYYSQPPPAAMGYPPPPAGYGGAPPPPNGTATPPVNPALSNLPPNLMMLLQSQQGLRGGAPPPGPPGPPSGYGGPPPGPPGGGY